jgi:hypothetical protein
MFCPVCGALLANPARAGSPYPMHVCTADGLVYDQTRNLWYGLPENLNAPHCPVCGMAMETESARGPPTLHFCFQCGVTYDGRRKAWYGVLGHAPAP